jgi:hypothetical protein
MVFDKCVFSNPLVNEMKTGMALNGLMSENRETNVAIKSAVI